MAAKAPSFTLGIEEEYLLVDRQTRDIVPEPPDDMLAACEAVAPDQVHPEFLRCQIEIGTRVCSDLSEAKGELSRLRLSVADVVSRYVERRSLDQRSVESLDWYLTFSKFKLAVILEQIHARHESGQTMGTGFEGIDLMVDQLLDECTDPTTPVR